MAGSNHDLIASLRPLLAQALSLAPEERTGWIERLRLESPATADELEALLAEEDQLEARGFLRAGAFGDFLPDEPPLASRQVGAYTLEQPVGHGGTGSVWLARRSDGRYEGRAAVKLLNVALLDPVGRERFRREASALARLSHPNIARLIDAGVTPDGRSYLVLEYVEGARIDQYCDERRLGPMDRIGLFQQVLAAVTHAHVNLVVHRDLKPSNILVQPDGTVKLLDFGIARLLEEGSAESPSTLTDVGGRMLTPAYASPEQVEGGPVTTATDVYALGVLLYLLLTGKHPTGGGSEVGAQLHGIMTVEPLRLDAGLRGPEGARAAALRGTAVSRLRRLYAGDLANIVAKALKKRPSDRYPTAEAFAADLRRYLRGEPVTARGDGFGYRAARFVTRHRVAVIAGALTSVALVTATAVSIRKTEEARRQRDAALRESRRADAQLEFQHLLLSDIGSGRVTMRDILDRGRVLLEQEYAGDPALAAGIALSLAEAYGEAGAGDQRLGMAVRAESLATAAGNPDLLLSSNCAHASALANRNRLAEAIALEDRIRPALGAASPETAIGCLAELAAVEARRARFDSAAVLTGRAAALLERAGDSSSTRYINVLNSEANALENLKRRREALALYWRLARLMDRTGRGHTSTRNVIRNNIGLAMANLGEMTAAEPIQREALALSRRSNPDGEAHPVVIFNYCRTTLFLQKLDTTAVWYRQLYEQSKAHGDDFMQAEGAHGLAQVALARGQLAEAERWIAEEARLIRQRGERPPGTALALEASLAAARGELPAANRVFTDALRAMGYFDGRRSYQMREVLVRAARVALDSRDPAKAVSYARAAAEIATSDALSETRSAYVGEARLLEGRGLLAQGDTASARTILARAVAALRFGAGADHPEARAAEEALAALPS